MSTEHPSGWALELQWKRTGANPSPRSRATFDLQIENHRTTRRFSFRHGTPRSKTPNPRWRVVEFTCGFRFANRKILLSGRTLYGSRSPVPPGPPRAVIVVWFSVCKPKNYVMSLHESQRFVSLTFRAKRYLPNANFIAAGFTLTPPTKKFGR